MRHLKRFNEGVNYKALHEFCDENLAFLIDKGFHIDILQSRYNSGTDITITKNKGDGFFEWEDVKYDFIPFILLLNETFDVDDINIGVDNNPVYYTIEEIEDEDTEYLGEISFIEFKLSRK